MIRIERAGQIATIWLDNPPVNAVTLAMLEALQMALDGIEGDARVRCVVLAGAGDRAFCVGADLREQQAGDAVFATAFRAAARRTVARLEGLRRPVVAALHGWCMGGGTALGWVCDIRIAADNTVFRAGDAYLGVMPSWGMGLQRLPRLVGRNHAMDLLLLGEDFGPQRAYELGLVSRVVPRAGLDEAAQAAALRIASASPAAILATRRAVQFTLRHGWEEAAAFEEQVCAEMAAHPDAQEGMQAFLEKRSPGFRDD